MNPLWVAGCATAGRIWNKRSGGQPGRLIADNVERMIVYLNRRVPLANGKGTALVSAMDYELVMPYHWFLQPADATHRASYALRNLGRSPDGKHRTQKMHQLITGQKNVDHKNLDGLDNRRTNLRPAGPPDQAANHGKRADNTSGYIGVSWDKQYGKGRAQVRKNGKTGLAALHRVVPELAVSRLPGVVGLRVGVNRAVFIGLRERGVPLAAAALVGVQRDHRTLIGQLVGHGRDLDRAMCCLRPPGAGSASRAPPAPPRSRSGLRR